MPRQKAAVAPQVSWPLAVNPLSPALLRPPVVEGGEGGRRHRLRDRRMVGRAHVQELEGAHAQRRTLGGAGAVELRNTPYVISVASRASRGSSAALLSVDERARSAKAPSVAQRTSTVCATPRAESSSALLSRAHTRSSRPRLTSARADGMAAPAGERPTSTAQTLLFGR